MLSKICNKCNVEKTIDNFSKDVQCKLNVKPSCKQCIAVLDKVWYKKNKERLKINKTVYDALPESKAKNAARTAKKRAKRLKRIPAWLTEFDLFFITEIYDLARLRTDCTGVQWHVDHILPLCGRTVSGLHTPYNLQLLSAKDNIVKSNKYNNQ